MIPVQPSAVQKITARHLSRQAMLYMLSRDFVVHMFTPYAIFARVCIAQGNWRWTLQQPLRDGRRSGVCVHGFLANAIKITR